MGGIHLVLDCIRPAAALIAPFGPPGIAERGNTLVWGVCNDGRPHRLYTALGAPMLQYMQLSHADDALLEGSEAGFAGLTRQRKQSRSF